MKVDFLSQAGKIIKEHKQYKRQLVLFLCLAVMVTFGTIAALKLYGQAMTHKKEVLDCGYQVHEHTDKCYEADEEGNLGTEPVCGYADYVFHVHNDGCYGPDGSLVCVLEEHKAHEHTEECYVTESILVCGETSAEDRTDMTEAENADGAGVPEESTDGGAGNGDVSAESTDGGADNGDVSEESTDGGADNGDVPAESMDGADPAAQAAYSCGMEAHIHEESCFENVIQCGFEEEHVHDAGCLNHELECVLGEHEHTEECYDAEGNLICVTEEHAHIIGCFDENGEVICGTENHLHGEGCLDGEGNAVCGLEEHEHIAGCYRNTYVCGKAVHTHQEECYVSTSVCGMEEHEHGDDCIAPVEESEAANEAAASEGNQDASQTSESEPEEAGDNGAEAAGTADGAAPESGEAGHVHTEACYETVTELVCGEQEIHTHDDSCYDESCFDEDGNLVEGSRVSCGLLQLEEHMHTTDCYKTVELTPEEVAALESGAKLHMHTEDCYGEEGELVCGHDATHIHILECYDDTGKLICGYGTASHVHEDSCYDEAGNRNCGYETASHGHEAECYDEEGNLICGYETASHGHKAECRDEEGKLICGYETASHVHEKNCWDEEGNLICGYETATHVHGAACQDGEGNIVCGYEAASHVHGKSCRNEEGDLVCGYETASHGHQAECRNEEGKLICGYDTASHVHKADCCDQEGNLICGYDTASHGHQAECRDEEGNLICGYATASHVHETDCRDEEGNLICGYDTASHVHEMNCYDEEGNLICGYETAAHVHERSCYDEEGNLICGYAEAEIHEHDVKCYNEEGELICGWQEARDHEHDEVCYDQEGILVCGYEGVREHEHDADCRDKEGILVCGYKGVKTHEHDGECYDEEGILTCGYEGVKDHEHDAKCFDILDNPVCGYEGVEMHVHTEGCLDEEGNLTCGYEVPELYENSKVYEDAGEKYIVVVKYNNDANIPEEAELRAEEITPDSDKEHYEDREAEYQKVMKDTGATMRALLKIGFYLDGEEIEPSAPVAVAVQFLDEDGLAEGKPITVIHFAEEGTEKLDGSNARDNSTTFKIGSFSEIAIGYGSAEKEKPVRDGKLYISNDFEFDADPFHIVFHVEGEARTIDGKPVIINMAQAGENTEIPASDGEGTGEADEAEGTEAGTSEDSEGTAEADEAESEESTEAGTSDSQESAEADTSDSEETAENDGNAADLTLQFHVKSLDDDPEMQEALTDYLGASTETVNRNILHMISYYMTYGELELDLSGCTVTAEVSLMLPSSTGEEGAASENGTEDGTAENDINAEAGEPAADIPGEDGETVIVPPENAAVVDEIAENTEVVEALKNELTSETQDMEISVMAMEVSETNQVSGLAKARLDEENQTGKMNFSVNSRTMVLAEESSAADPVFTVQYYAYAQIMETENPGGTDVEAIKIIDTCLTEGVLGAAQLPANGTELKTRFMYVKDTGRVNDNVDPNAGFKKEAWEIYEPVYKDRESTDSLTKLYTADRYNFREMASGLDHINKFAKDGLHFDLYEVWVRQDGNCTDEKSKEGWTVYSGEQLSQLQFTNNGTLIDNDNPNLILISSSTVIRLVGKSNTDTHNYPARFFDYDISDGSNSSNKVYRKGINAAANYSGNAGTDDYGFGNNNNGNTGLAGAKLDGHYINQAVAENDGKILKKCSYRLVKPELSEKGLPVIRANAPDLFNPENKNVNGRTEISGSSLNFKRDGDTYTLTSVTGPEAHAENLQEFQKGVLGWKSDDQIWTNQFWPMDRAHTFGAAGHDPKFGTKEQNETTGFIPSDDGREHNSFFGMTFEVEFELTDDYVGPLNYYFFGDDDMWVFLVDQQTGSSQLICDIGGVHQAAGEYVDLWNYIQRPPENFGNDAENGTGNSNSADDSNEERENLKYKLKFFYTERGASGSTCWMQFTLPSVNAVPVIDYTGNVKSTLTLGKTVEGEEGSEITNERFDFTITFEGEAGNIALNNYPYQIKDKAENIVESGDICSGGTFKLGHNQTIEVFNLPDGTRYTIKEKEYPGYDPGLGGGSTGTINKDDTVEGNIDWNRDDIVNYINKEIPYHLPETGGSGNHLYTIAGGMALLLGAGFLYKNKFGERRGRKL